MAESTSDPFAAPSRAWGVDFVSMSMCAIGAVAVTALGEVWCWGEVPHCGDLADLGPLRSAVGGIELTGTGHGYWLWMRDGTIYPYGDAARPGPQHKRKAEPAWSPRQVRTDPWGR